MPQQNDLSSHIVIRTLDDTSQRDIIEKRRKAREKLLKRIGQQTSVTERNIELLYELTR